MNKILNLSNINSNQLYSWIPHDLKYENIIFFPDACPGKSPLPTGTVVNINQNILPKWRKYAISDCGCGMLFAKSSKINISDFSKKDWDSIYYDLIKNKGKLGDLGSGNHFLDTLESYNDKSMYFLIHTGSRNESKLVDHLIDNPKKFDEKFTDICNWAKDNRYEIFKILEKYFGNLEIICDKNHNHYELMDDNVIIRKGAVKCIADDFTIIPSSMCGDVVLVKATENVKYTYNSLCHGTGRVMSRGDIKEYAKNYNYEELRNKVYIPSMISNDSIKTDIPICYRDLDECLNMINDYVQIIDRYSVIAYLGQI